MKRRVGFVGHRNVPVGVAFEGILHLERTHKGMVSLCNRPLTMTEDPDKLLADKGYLIKELKICKRCEAKA